MLDAERDRGGGQQLVFAMPCRPKDGLMECRKLKLPTSWNAAGMFLVAGLAAFIGVSTEARAMLVYSYYTPSH
jgi:hypothetical protein